MSSEAEVNRPSSLPTEGDIARERTRFIVRGLDPKEGRTVWTSPFTLDMAGRLGHDDEPLELVVEPPAVRIEPLSSRLAHMRAEAFAPASLFAPAWAPAIVESVPLPGGWTAGPGCGVVTHPALQSEHWPLWGRIAACGTSGAVLIRFGAQGEVVIERRDSATAAPVWSRSWREIVGGDARSGFATGLSASHDRVVVWQSPWIAMLNASSGSALWVVNVDELVPPVIQSGVAHGRCKWADLQAVPAGDVCFVASWTFAAALDIDHGSLRYWIEYPEGSFARPYVRGSGPVFVVSPRVVFVHMNGRTRLESSELLSR